MRIMENKKELKAYRRFVLSLCIIAIMGTITYSYCYIKNDIPRDITIKVNKVGKFKSSLPLTAIFDQKSVGVLSVDNKKIKNQNTEISICDNFSLKSSKVGEFKADLKAFGLIKLKEVNVKVIEDKEMLVGGIPVGIYMETDGLLVLGTSKIKSANGVETSNASKVVRSGDYILALNGHKLSNKKEFIDILKEYNSTKVNLTIRRDGHKFDVVVKGVKMNRSDSKLGIWIRNDMQGIGTLTYYDPSNKTYGALGHGINDVDTNTIMTVKKGAIFQAGIVDIVKGIKDNPGELVGVINHSEKHRLGTLAYNSPNGIHGLIENNDNLTEQIGNDNLKDRYKIALKQDLKVGKATLRTKVSDEIKDYKINIQQIDINSGNSNKNFVIHIVDKELLKKTGGIVQGMSGSPIIQDGKLVGAVTHVLVNDPTRGYGIFIENMI
ncbi:MAG: SpoIVB peptidase [Lachnospiraceae bacterium]|nr:SpoIVB peptidase [Lachnospiraceae bacterium]